MRTPTGKHLYYAFYLELWEFVLDGEILDSLRQIGTLVHFLNLRQFDDESILGGCFEALFPLHAAVEMHLSQLDHLFRLFLARRLLLQGQHINIARLWTDFGLTLKINNLFSLSSMYFLVHLSFRSCFNWTESAINPGYRNPPSGNHWRRIFCRSSLDGWFCAVWRSIKTCKA